MVKNANTKIPLKKTNESDSAKEIRRLNQMLKEKDKEIDFKKTATFFTKEID